MQKHHKRVDTTKRDLWARQVFGLQHLKLQLAKHVLLLVLVQLHDICWRLPVLPCTSGSQRPPSFRRVVAIQWRGLLHICRFNSIRQLQDIVPHKVDGVFDGSLNFVVEALVERWHVT